MSNNIRTAAAVAAQIEAINAAAEANQTPADGGLLTVLTLEERAAKAIEKFEKAKAAYDAQAAVRDIEVGNAVTAVFGRAHNKQIVSGSVLHVEQEATGLSFTVLVGQGKASRTITVSADAILLDADAVAAAEADIAAAVEAKAKADAEKEAAKAE
ncbi:hypothetical protein [Stenotrophomonas phage vB_SmeS_BUCT700]|uniref:Uncharacterized protein n=1 Tax=Stenotrophomonas phage vB_SmeS_BUCT700 TaxID=2924895 RepID=A0AAE9GD04_9CAUD|nr:hypothetical protein [Stenotrophomonas phage vB_SmeS_BUCT700]UNY50300.1 hypothetical protein [Stenotrophomonas phage vB_SmeS_BUCT703]